MAETTLGSSHPDSSAPPKIVVRYADAVAELDALEPLWNALHEHHAAILPTLGEGTPSRGLDDAWRLRHAKYECWLGDADSFFALAESDGEPAGYAFVTVGLGYASWATGERMAVLETLSVLPEHRGGGLGGTLLDAVWERLAEIGVDEMALTSAVANVDSHRFYEKNGFQRGFAVYYGQRPPQ